MQWLREPLVHFLVLGAGLFVLYGAVAAPEPEGAVIDLSAGDVEQLVRVFEKTFKRPPTAEEFDGLIEDRIRDEVLYREALAMGFDRDDTIVRRRLRQKVEFLFSDIAGLVEPTETDLAAYLEEHADAFRRPDRVSFRHVYLNRDQRGDAAFGEAERLLARLEAAPDADVGALGDPFLLPREYQSVTEGEVTKRFNRDFTERLRKQPTGRWLGPMPSKYGLHLVRVSERVEGELPELADVRQQVERDWSEKRRKESSQAYYKGLRKRYTIRVERPDDAVKMAEAR